MAYRGLAKECHPDYLGNEGHNICILLNEVGDPPPFAATAGPSKSPLTIHNLSERGGIAALKRFVPALRPLQHLNASVLQAYEVLSSPETRASYNQQLQSALIEAMDDFTGNPYSKWLVGHRLGKAHDLNEDRAVFVVRFPLPHFSPFLMLPPASCNSHGMHRSPEPALVTSSVAVAASLRGS